MDPVSALRAWRRCEDAVALTACSVSLQNVVQCSNELPFAHVYDTRHTQAGGFNGNGIDSTATPTMTASPWSSVDANAYAYAYAHVFAHSICDGIAMAVGSTYRMQALARSTHKASTHSRKKNVSTHQRMRLRSHLPPQVSRTPGTRGMRACTHTQTIHALKEVVSVQHPCAPVRPVTSVQARGCTGKGDGQFNVVYHTAADFPSLASQSGVQMVAGDFNGDGVQPLCTVAHRWTHCSGSIPLHGVASSVFFSSERRSKSCQMVMPFDSCGVCACVLATLINSCASARF